jgi:predicted PurR-regulated permease PerM
MGDESSITATEASELAHIVPAVDHQRDRMLSAITLIGGLALMLALPFALQAGAEFFLPVTAALVVAVALVPLLEWLERRGAPSGFAALICVIVFIAVANIAIASIILPASDWFQLLPERISRIRTNLGPIIDIYSSIDRFVNDTMAAIAKSTARHHVRTVQLEQPNSLLDLIAMSAPMAIIQMFFALLVIYFFLAGWTKMRRRTITNRGSFTSAMATARVIQEMVDATSAYLATITAVNVCMGTIVALALWWVGMPTPIMWGGLVAILNYIPYRCGATAGARGDDDLR